jgi:gluconokinase
MVIIMMGVSGAGKTTIGRLLASELGYDYAEGDSYHPPANIEKMSAGIPLDDSDRQPWLERMAADIDSWLAHARPHVLACSALKRRYRDILIGSRDGVRLVFLHGSPSLINQRLRQRSGHYMPPSLLDSQFAALEPPAAEERALSVNIDAPAPTIIAELIRRLTAADG